MKKVFFKSVLISAVVILGGCGSSAGTGSSSTTNDSDYTTDTSGSDYTTDTSSSGYTAESRSTSITECVELGADINLCECVYDFLSANLTFSELNRIDGEIRNGASASDYPVMVQANEYCV